MHFQLESMRLIHESSPHKNGMGLMDLKRLKHIVALADERNFARAAERVALTQSALSRSVQAAETELELLLFDRSPAEVIPTPAGVFVIERARKILLESNNLERDIGMYRAILIGELRMGAGPFPAETLLPVLMPELCQRYPGVRVRVEVNNWSYLVQHLRREELDFFVADIRDLPSGPDLEVSVLARQFGGFYVRAGHPLLKRRMIRATDMAAFGLATVRMSKAIVAALAQLMELAPATPLPLVLECDDVQLLKRTTMDSDTVLFSTHASVMHEVSAGKIFQVSVLNLPPLYVDTGVVSLRGRGHSPVAIFVMERLKAISISHALEFESRFSTRIRAIK